MHDDELRRAAKEVMLAFACIRDLTRRGKIGTASWDEAFAWQAEALERLRRITDRASVYSSIAKLERPKAAEPGMHQSTAPKVAGQVEG